MVNKESGSNKRGFTLLELLIVISIIAILSVILIIALNPAETLRKARDIQRMSDLASLKTALGIYVTTVSSPDLDAAIANHCHDDGETAAKISYSMEIADVACTANVTEGTDVGGSATSTYSTTDFCRYVGTTGAPAVDGTGWVPVNLGGITGGAPISSMPLDPTNTVASSTVPASTDLVYRYSCQGDIAGSSPDLGFELNAQLESTAFTSTDDKRTTDGGDNTSYYEVGTSVKLMGSGTNY